MQPMTEVSFHWKHWEVCWEVKEEIYAVTKAVSAKYNTKGKLLEALPQFAPRRIALAIDVLISANLAQVNFDVLEVQTYDMNVVFELVKNDKKIEIPMSLEAAKDPSMVRRLIHGLGCRNPAGVETLVWMKTPKATEA